MREFHGLATIDKGLGHQLTVSFVATVWFTPATGSTEVEYHTELSFSVDGVDCDKDYLKQTFGPRVAESAVQRAVDNALTFARIG